MRRFDLRWRWPVVAAGVLLLLLLLPLLWFAGPVGDDREASDLKPVALSPWPTDAVLQPPLPASAPAAALNPPSPSDERAPGVDEIQLCGGAWVKVQADGALDQADLERATHLPQARARISAALRADTSDLAQATALWLAMLAGGADAPRARDALVQKAVSSSDPKTYALAFNSCGGERRNEGACPMLHAGQWARLDPGNVSPWLAMLSDARARQDRAAEEEALHRIATAQRSELGTFVLPGLVVNAAPTDDASVLAAWAMANDMIGAASAWGMPGYQHLMDACNGAALRDANRRQTCAGIAELLSEHSDTVIERLFGALIGRQVGWPAERIDRLRGEYAAYGAALGVSGASDMPGGGQRGISCAGLRRDLDGLRRLASLGETGVLRAWVAQSGKTPEDFVREERAQQTLALQDARAQTAAAAASAASAARR